MKKIVEKIEYCIKNKSYVKIKLIDDSITLQGIILSTGKNWIFTMEFNDFSFIGYKCINAKRIEKIKISKVFNKIFHKYITITNSSFIPNLNSTRELLSSLKNLPISIESFIDKKTNYYKIGLIENLNKKSVDLKIFGANAKWQKELFTAKYDYIVEISFENEYIDLYYKYILSKGDNNPFCPK